VLISFTYVNILLHLNIRFLINHRKLGSYKAVIARNVAHNEEKYSTEYVYICNFHHV